MNELKVKDLIKCTKGKLILGKEEEICDDFSKDTRTIKDGDIYIGIKGQNFDGNTMWEKALENGAKGVIVQGINFSEENLEKWKEKIIIKVEDSLEALYKIAEYKRSLYNIPVIGITGSVGKTSTKDIVANVVSQKYNTLKTQGNYNNNIGVPFTILNLKDHEAAVIEMGMNHLREISLLTKIAKPTISIITNIGTSHIGNLGSRENILKAKLEILEGMEKPILVINNDNDLLSKWGKENKDNIEIHTYGIEEKSEVNAKEIIESTDSSEFVCEINNKKIKIHVPVGGIHFVYNAICAVTVANLLGIEEEKIKNGIETFELTKKRMDIIELESGVKLIDDSYNASLESMQVALKHLSQYRESRKIAVLGDMLELGDFAKELHEEVGKKVIENNIDILFCCGENAKYIANKAQEQGMKNVFYFTNKEEMQNKLKDTIEAKDVILFKASNGMKFSSIIEFLKDTRFLKNL